MLTCRLKIACALVYGRIWLTQHLDVYARAEHGLFSEYDHGIHGIHGIPCSMEHSMKCLLSEIVESGVDYYVIGVAENACAISFRIQRLPTEILHGTWNTVFHGTFHEIFVVRNR